MLLLLSSASMNSPHYDIITIIVTLQYRDVVHYSTAYSVIEQEPTTAFPCCAMGDCPERKCSAAPSPNFICRQSLSGIPSSGVGSQFTSEYAKQYTTLWVTVTRVNYITPYISAHHLEQVFACLEGMASSECGSQNLPSDVPRLYLAASFQPNTWKKERVTIDLRMLHHRLLHESLTKDRPHLMLCPHSPVASKSFPSVQWRSGFLTNAVELGNRFSS